MTDTRTGERIALAPDLRSLSDRGARAWTERMAVRQAGAEYVVDSESDNSYVVDPEAGTCTCPDSRLRGQTCKHRRRVAIEITLGRVPPPGMRRGTCVACGEGVFVSKETPALCSGCRLEEGAVVVDRETGDRLVVAELLDGRADEVPAAGTTVAAYPTNEGYPPADPVVEAVYLSSLPAESPRPYRFPLSRLDPADDAAVLTATAERAHPPSR